MRMMIRYRNLLYENFLYTDACSAFLDKTSCPNSFATSRSYNLETVLFKDVANTGIIIQVQYNTIVTVLHSPKSI